MKNKKVLSFLAIAGILITILYATNDMPEDKNLSSGYSFAADNIQIDNYKNVMTYDYEFDYISELFDGFYVLKDMDFRFSNYEYSKKQFLQGICFTDKYLFITSYSQETDTLGELKVYDKETEAHLITFGLDKGSHLGGVAFDGENLWICNSANTTLERIPYTFLCSLIEENPGKTLDISDWLDSYKIDNIPSCITYHDGLLWVGTHDIWRTSKMIAYQFNVEKDELTIQLQCLIPPQVQGFVFNDEGEIFFSTSYGRRKSSYILKYDSLSALSKSIENFEQLVELPPCSEEIAIDEENLYVLFESANCTFISGSDGKGISLSPIDKILVLDIQSR